MITWVAYWSTDVINLGSVLVMVDLSRRFERQLTKTVEPGKLPRVSSLWALHGVMLSQLWL